jgi:hypothetical protein
MTNQGMETKERSISKEASRTRTMNHNFKQKKQQAKAIFDKQKP